MKTTETTDTRTLSEKRRAASLARTTFSGGHGKRSKKIRCECGQMTAKRALARGHYCGAEAVATKAADEITDLWWAAPDLNKATKMDVVREIILRHFKESKA
jgi:hypothetical protein